MIEVCQFVYNNDKSGKMKKILCPIDFSDIAQNAIAYAAKLSKATGATLKLLNVQPNPVFANAAENALVLEAVTGRLEELGSDVRRFLKISCETEVIQSGGLLSDVIVESADNFDLIVMGTHGVENLLEFLRGSNTYHAIRKSEIPVLLVPEGYVYSEIKSTVYAYNYLAKRTLPLTQLIPWIRSLKCQLTVLQVNEEAISEDVNDEMKELQFIFNEHLKGEDISIQFDSTHSSEIAPAIHSYIHRSESDLLVLCTTQRNFIEAMFHKSVIKIITEIANYPVMVLHK